MESQNLKLNTFIYWEENREKYICMFANANKNNLIKTLSAFSCSLLQLQSPLHSLQVYPKILSVERHHRRQFNKTNGYCQTFFGNIKIDYCKLRAHSLYWPSRRAYCAIDGDQGNRPAKEISLKTFLSIILPLEVHFFSIHALPSIEKMQEIIFTFEWDNRGPPYLNKCEDYPY